MIWIRWTVVWKKRMTWTMVSRKLRWKVINEVINVSDKRGVEVEWLCHYVLLTNNRTLSGCGFESRCCHWKKCLDFGEKQIPCLFSFMSWIFHLKCCFKGIYEKNSEAFPGLPIYCRWSPYSRKPRLSWKIPGCTPVTDQSV